MQGSYKNKLTSEQRNTIVQMFNDGVPVFTLAKQFEISRPTVYNVLEKAGNTNHKKIEFYVGKSDKNKEEMEIISEKFENIILNGTNTPSKTNFLGITIDTENGSNNPKVRKALNASFNLLDITQFVKVTKFKLNMTMFDYFWQVVVGNTRVHLVSRVLEWFGYTGEIKEQRKNFIRMLKRNGIEYTELTQKDKEIELYPTIQEEVQLLPSNVTNSKFLIMEPDDLKMAIMQLKTKNGHIIRQYYIDLEKLLRVYTEYTLYFNHREATRKITDLEQTMRELKESNQRQEKYMRSLGIQLEDVKDQNEVLIDNNKDLKKEVKKVQHKLGIAVVDRAPLPLSEDKQERFVLIKRNDDEYYSYYTIRAQYKYTERRIKTQRLLFPNLEILLDFKANPNSKTLYTRIKEKLVGAGVLFEGNNIEIEGTKVTQDELIEEMKVTSNQKYNV
ncbi:hypothetical protein IIV25_134R [Invertebrate iridovirus 25]|uniref:Uncharacterized protein n=1 Tax=Invertebrate iridovirus 25 TaxID=1301280 RepID=W8W1L4_9VIRU|nr:hypothetical protein IIV25_134R [Invertebrate iridovirus 25]CCV02152.1 hypothetical protein IIV25_134R [Invertebrate iridovirus 25]